MKKNLLKIFSLMVILLGAIFMLTGCGDNDDSESSKKKDKDNEEVISVSGDNIITGKMEEDDGNSKIEMSFDDNDILEKLVFTFNFNDEEDAKELYESSQEEIEGTNIKVVRDDKKVTIAFSAEDFSKKYGIEADKLDKETMKQFAEYMGYELED